MSLPLWRPKIPYKNFSPFIAVSFREHLNRSEKKNQSIERSEKLIPVSGAIRPFFRVWDWITSRRISSPIFIHTKFDSPKNHLRRRRRGFGRSSGWFLSLSLSLANWPPNSRRRRRLTCSFTHWGFTTKFYTLSEENVLPIAKCKGMLFLWINCVCGLWNVLSAPGNNSDSDHVPIHTMYTVMLFHYRNRGGRCEALSKLVMCSTMHCCITYESGIFLKR